jgi:hypothetical protein
MLHLMLLLIIERLLGNYVICLVSPWWLTLRPSKWSPLRLGFLLGGPLDDSRAIPDHTYHFSHFILSSPYLLGFSSILITNPRRDCTSFHGRTYLSLQDLVD